MWQFPEKIQMYKIYSTLYLFSLPVYQRVIKFERKNLCEITCHPEYCNIVHLYRYTWTVRVPCSIHRRFSRSKTAEDVCRAEAEREQTVYLIHRPWDLVRRLGTCICTYIQPRTQIIHGVRVHARKLAVGNRESVMNLGRGERTSSFLTESKTRKSRIFFLTLQFHVIFYYSLLRDVM